VLTHTDVFGCGMGCFLAFLSGWLLIRDGSPPPPLDPILSLPPASPGKVGDCLIGCMFLLFLRGRGCVSDIGAIFDLLSLLS